MVITFVPPVTPAGRSKPRVFVGKKISPDCSFPSIYILMPQCHQEIIERVHWCLFTCLCIWQDRRLNGFDSGISFHWWLWSWKKAFITDQRARETCPAAEIRSQSLHDYFLPLCSSLMQEQAMYSDSVKKWPLECHIAAFATNFVSEYGACICKHNTYNFT